MRALALALLLALIPCPAAAQTLTEGVTQMLDGLDLSPLEEAVGASDPFAATGGFRQTLQGIALGQLTLDFDQVMQLITSRFCSAVTGSLWRLTRLAAPALIWSLLCRLLGKKSEAGQVVCMLMICVFLVSDLSDHTALCLRSVERMSSGMQGLFPLLLTVMAALGGSAGSALMQPAVVASAGAMTARLKLRDVVAAQGACTNSNYLAQFGMPGVFAPIADFTLLETAVAIAREKGVRMPVGNVLSSDVFYDASGKSMDWARMGVLCAEMETAALYANAAFLGKRALSLLTISDSIVTGEALPAEDRQNTFTKMMEIALEIA